MIDITSLQNKTDNEKQAKYASTVDAKEKLTAEEFVEKIVKPIKELLETVTDIQGKAVYSIKQGSSTFTPEDNVITFPLEGTLVKILCQSDIKLIISVDGTCKVSLAFTSVLNSDNTFELVDVKIQALENGERVTVGTFSASTSDFNAPTYKEYDLTEYGLTSGTYENLLLYATGRTTLVSGSYLFTEVALTDLSISLARDYHTAITSTGDVNDSFPLVYKVNGSVSKTLFISIKGSSGTMNLTYNLDSSYDNTTVRYSLKENSAYGILTHGVHEVIAYLRCDDGKGGYLYSNVLDNNFMVVNTTTEGADLTLPYIMILNSMSYELYLASTYSNPTNFVQSTLCNFAVFSPRLDENGNLLNDGGNIDVTFLLTSADDGFGNWEDEYFRINYSAAPATRLTLDTTVEIEAEEGEESTTEYYTYLRVYRTDADGNDHDFLNESNGVTNKYIKVDNTESFSPMSGANFLLNPKVRNNSESNPARILNARNNNTEVDSTWEGFGFVNDGWITTDDDNLKVLRVPAGCTLTIDYNPFKLFLTNPDSSMTFDVDFKVRNVTNEENAIFLIAETILGTGVTRGLLLRAIDGAMYTASNTLETECNFFWLDEQRQHLSLNICNSIEPGGDDALHPSSSTTLDLSADSIPLVRIFLNGVIVREMKFNTASVNEFCTSSTSNGGIKIGQDGADIDIYSIRCYENNLITASEVLQNYISTLPTSDEKKAIREANDILTSGRIDLAKVKAKGKRCLVWHGTEPYYQASGAQTGWWEIFQYNDDGTLNRNLSGTIAKETKKLIATRQGSTANTYYYSNLQTKIKDLADEDYIKVNVNSLHSSIHLGTPSNVLDDDGNDTGKMTVKIWGGNLGKQYPVYEDADHAASYEYISEDGNNYVMVPDGWVDGNDLYRGLGYLICDDIPLGLKLVAKINYASCMQSHLLGCTRAYNDLHRKVVGDNGIQKTVTNARVAKYTEPFFLFTQAEGSSSVYFRGPCTFGPGKMDKPTWGYDKKSYPMFCMIEGSDNNYEQTDFLVPWDTNEIYYDPDGEGWVHYGLQGWDFDAGAVDEVDTNGDGETDLEYPLGTIKTASASKDFMTRIREIFNWIYMHSTSIAVYAGTFEKFKASTYATTNLKYKYWCTTGDDAFKLKRYKYYKYVEEYVNTDGDTVQRTIDKSGWVDAGLPNGSVEVTNSSGLKLYWKSREHNVCSSTVSDYPVMESTFAEVYVAPSGSHEPDEMFGDTYTNSSNKALFAALNSELINSLVAHAKKYIGWYIKPESLRFHYCFINNLMCGTDNCSKNTYYVLDPVALDITIDDTTKSCYLLELHQDDVDTIFGTDNNGRTTKPYYIDRMHQYADTDLSTSLYEGNANVLFNLCEKMYEGTKELLSTMKSIFTAMTELVSDTDELEGMEDASSNVSVWGFFHKYFFSTQYYFPIVMWNEAARIRYEYPKMLGFISSGSGARHVDPITQSLGDQLQSELQYMKRRLIYECSYAAWGLFYDSGKTYNIGVPDIADTFSMLAFHLPHETQSAIDYKFNVVPHQYMYPTGMMGQTSIDPHVRVAPGESFELDLGTTSTNDTGMSILGINFYRSIGNIGDLSTSPALKLTINGKRLTDFTAIPTKTYLDMTTGNMVPAFRPGSIEVQANRIETLSIYGCKLIGGTLDLDALARLKTLDLRDTNISACTLPKTSTLETVRFPNNFTELDFEDLVNLSTILLQGYADINSIIVKNCSLYTYEYVMDIVNKLIAISS